MQEISTFHMPRLGNKKAIKAYYLQNQEDSTMDHTSAQTFPSNRRGISGSTLKLIAIFTMLIDHTAASILGGLLIKRGIYSGVNFNNYAKLYTIYEIMRLIGRLAFPIFCFLLVEGMVHTHNKYKYAMRLALFALISEIPFDLGLQYQPFNWDHQNVFFTLLIGLLVMIGFDTINKTLKDKKWLPALAVIGLAAAGYISYYVADALLETTSYLLTFVGINTRITFPFARTSLMIAIFSIISFVIYILLWIKKSASKASILFSDMVILAAGVLLADYLKTDYSGFGIITIAVIYGLRRYPLNAIFGGCITLTIMSYFEISAFFDLLFIKFYNGKRGLSLKYVFYLFYPVHLVLLYLICYLLKLL
jgi:hypothetical protein